MSVALSAAPERKLAAPLIAFALLVLGGLFLFNAVSARQAILFIVGGALGLTLYHAAFGFTSAWRVFIRERRGAGLRAQMVMLALAVLLFFPALAAGSLFGQPVSGFVSPVGTSVIVGAFIFGIGMQLGGGCASGTLFTVGGGNARMLVTLLFFILGSLIATQHVGWWFALPSLPPISLVAELGLAPALVLSLAVFIGIAGVTVRMEKARHGTLETPPSAEWRGWRRFLRGPWPLVWGALALALLNFLTLYLAGRPWGITSAFALWGEDRPGRGPGRRRLGLLADAGERQGAGRAAVGRHHQRDGHRHRPRRAARRRPGRTLRAEPGHPAPFAGGGGDRRAAARLRRAPGLWLQHRRVFQRDRVRQPAWLVVVGGGICRQQRRGTGIEALFLPGGAAGARVDGVLRGDMSS